MSNSQDSLEGIAIVGMAGRFPGAQTVAEFWKNLIAGAETISTLTDEQLSAAGVKKEDAYVPRRGLLERPEFFDATFFGISPREAEAMDPQQRIFLEEAWTALEDAACDSARYAGAIGVFAGMSNNTYWANNVVHHPELIASVGWLTAMMGNEKDYLATRTAYKLNLRGPAISIHTACSTSLVAVCQAVQSLLSYGCDMALAGGVSATFPHERGYVYDEGGILSPDGHCRAFDVNSAGTVFSNGCGVVALKRLADAVADGDRVYAVIKGAALNNDGSNKVSFTAPSVDGHTEVIALAQALAGVEPRSIGYVEAHGTATPLGDPIEIAGLTQAFRAGTDERGFCALGSVKSNIGHLDAAAGVAGLIKTALVLHHGRIPASLHFTAPNAKLDLPDSPFFVVKEPRDWPASAEPRRAAVSSFGVGGTNAHCVLEDFAAAPATTEELSPQVLTLSAKTETALATMAENLAQTLDANPQLSFGDIAHTLHVGRHEFAHRLAVAAAHPAAAVNALRGVERRSSVKGRAASSQPRVVFMFPGQGSQYAGMGAQLAAAEPVFRTALQRCAQILRPHLGCDLVELLSLTTDEARLRLRETRFTQPAIFSISYSLAELWRSWGVEPALMIGHSVGEYVAATLSGVFSLEDGLSLVAERARLVQAQPSGAMLAVRLPREEIARFCNAEISLAAVNGPSLCVLAGPSEPIAAVEQQLTAENVAAKRLETSHAFHSAMMEPAIAPLRAAAQKVSRNAPQTPILSTVTGDWLAAAEATDPEYWARHARATVQFSPAIARLLAEEDVVFLECGPGNTLTQLGKQHAKPDRVFASTLRDGVAEITSAHLAAGQLWTSGVAVGWRAMDQDRQRRKVSLPTYPFERQRYFAEAPAGGTATTQPRIELAPIVEATLEATSTTPEFRMGEVIDELQRLSGLDLTGASPDLSFTELGFDSLFLTQVAVALYKRFGVKITFRQLLQDLPSPAAVAEFLDKHAPAAAPSKKVAAAPAAPSNLPTPRAHGPFRGIDRTSTTLTPEQEAHVADLIASYTAKTAASKRATAQHRAHLADPRAVAGFRREWKEIVYPLICDRSEGAKLWDADGNEYTDITLGFGQILFGHRPQWLVDAVERQLKSGIEIGPTSSLAGALAERLSRYLGLERVAFCNTGSEAVAAALRVSRTVTGRERVAVFGGAYHGIFDEVLFRPGPAPIAPGIPQSAVQNLVVLEYGSDESLVWLRENASDLAAIIVEPVQSRHPALAPREFLHELRRIATAGGAALIFDEIVTGFRVAPGGAQEYFGVKADLGTYGKVIGGGMPIGIVGGSREYMDALDGGAWNYGDDSFPEIGVTFFAGTFVRHPLALAAASAVLDALERSGPELQRTLASRAAGLTARLNATLEAHGLSMRWQNFSSLYYLPLPMELRYAPLLFTHMRLRGLHVWENRPCFLCAEHTEADIDKIATVFEESVAAMAAAGLLGTVTPQAAAETSPLSDGQQEIFLAAQLGDDANAAFNDSIRLRIRGAIEPEKLRSALREVVQRHGALCTTISADGKTQRTHAAPDSVELAAVPIADEAALLRAIALQAEKPFALQHGPLWRATLFSLSESEHELVFTAHHIVCDGWSFSTVASELSALYSGATAASLPAPESLAAYNHEQIGRRKTAGFSTSEAWWLQQFATVPPLLDLPTDAPRSGLRSFRSATRSALLPAAICEALRKAAAANRSTVFASLFATFATLLGRLSGQAELVVGIASAGQTRVDGPLIGHCVNFLPLPVRLGSEASLTTALPALNTLILDAQEHQDLTFGRLLQKLSVPRVAGRMPLVSVSFNVDRAPGALPFGSATAEYLPAEKSRYHLELSFNLVEEAGGYRVFCHFNRDLFGAETIERWLSHYITLSAEIAARPDAPLRAHSLLTPVERRVLLDDLNQTAREYPRAVGLDTLFEKQAATSPEAIAIVDGGRRFTYAQLNEQSNALAASLVGRGLAAGSFVGLALERSAELIVATLAIIKAGLAYAPLDTSWPAERLRFMAEDMSLRVIIGSAELAGIERMAVTLDGAGSAENPSVPTDGGSTAYVIYTSGSTGTPKGVVVPHRAVSRLVLNTDYAALTADDAVGHASNPAFDAATFEIWGSLLNGGRLVVLPKATMLDPARLGAAIRAEGITAMFVTSALFNQVVNHAPATFQPLRHLLVGGDAVSSQAVGRVWESGAPARLSNAYGPTEVTTFAVTHLVTEHPHGAAIPIGRPIANTEAYVLDAYRQPVPLGVVGELFLGGDGLALGYHNRPELSVERFVPHPFKTGERLYRTGDSVRLRADGEIEFLGRLDNQIKLRGFRVELGEIEAEMANHPQVREVAVKVCGQEAGEKWLAAYVVARPGESLDEASLRASLAQRLPDYMVPTVFVSLERLPLNANGKVDKAALPEPIIRSQAPAPQSSTTTEARVAALMAASLRQADIPIDGDFFRLGGHSLLAMDLLARLKAEFGVELPASRIFETSTPSGLARFIDEHRIQAPPADSRFIVPVQRGNPGVRPLFLVAGGWGGEIEFLVYGQLARHLGEGQPIFGLKARGAGTGEEPHRTVAEMAADYLREIRAIQPHGPYLIAGECVGGICAHEIACQLRNAGEEVGLLLMLDTSTPNPAELAEYLRAEEEKRTLEAKSHSLLARVRSGISAVVKSVLGKPQTPAPVLHPRGQAEYPVTLMSHQLQPYSGRITLFIDAEAHAAYDRLGWEKIPGANLELHVLPGTHITYIRDNNVTAAAKLRELLDRATV